MKKYLSFFKIRFSNTLQYRSAAWAGVCTQFVWGFMKLLMFKAFYDGNPSAFPMTFQELSSYIWLQQSFLALFAFWFFDNDIFSTITDGNISYELLRPMNLYNMWFTKNMASRTAKALLRSVPILIIAALIPEPYRIGLPADWLSLLMFIVTLVFGLVVVVSTCMLIYISTIHTMSSIGIRVFAVSFVEIFSGAVVPLPFFPDGFRQFAELLPFASMNNLPFRIYSGNISGIDMWFLTLLQIFWIVTLGLVGRWWMKNSLKNVVIQGG